MPWNSFSWKQRKKSTIWKSIQTALDIALYEEDLAQIKDELTEYGYIRRHGSQKGAKRQSKSRPLPLYIL